MRSKLTLPILLIVVAVVLLFVWLAQRSGDPEPQELAGAAVEPSSPADDAASGAAAEPAVPQPRDVREPQPAAPPAPAAEASERGLVEAVKEWVGAWSEQRVDDYLASYARTFVPEDGIGRRLWEAQRRERISAPRFVRVAITGLETELLDAGTARATFLQYYRSDGYADTVRKTLDLVWEDGRWRIQRERSATAR